MSELNDPVFSAVLELSSEERGLLADRLLEKLHFGAGEEIDPAELEERIEALRSGNTERLQELQSVVQV